MSDRMSPFHCPYCGEEDLRPHEATHGAWECRACLRAFQVRFLGLLRPQPGGVGDLETLVPRPPEDVS